MLIYIIFAAENEIYQHYCEAAAGITLTELLQAEKNILSTWPVAATYNYSVYGQIVDANYILEDGDRVEILRPLLLSPMAARRLRAAKRIKK
jgi:putative ubiquitin-RnfH superfamily antitoxin RatB of RatAB toxin-antitoxin module